MSSAIHCGVESKIIRFLYKWQKKRRVLISPSKQPFSFLRRVMTLSVLAAAQDYLIRESICQNAASPDNARRHKSHLKTVSHQRSHFDQKWQKFGEKAQKFSQTLPFVIILNVLCFIRIKL